MPDLAGLTEAQKAALTDIGWMLDEYKQAIERRVAAEAAERKALAELQRVGYRIAGVEP